MQGVRGTGSQAERSRRFHERHPDCWAADRCRPKYIKWKKEHVEYKIYHDAKQRCTNPKDLAWAEYGGRGIKFLFASFKQFFAELGLRPAGKDARGKALYSLDRPNNDGNYEPGNVRWATRKEQNINRRGYGKGRHIVR